MTTSSTPFTFESIELSSDRLPQPVELNRIVTDVEIFEHMAKPYLTARILIIDAANFYQSADIVGSERIRIQIRSAEEDAKSIVKNFMISRVEKVDKIQDNTQVIAMHLVEDCYYISSLINLNRTFSGKPSAMLKIIAKETLKKELLVNGEEQQNFKLIIPNMHPLEAMDWIRSKTSTARGYPFFLYSTLVGDELIYEDLATILTRPALNAGNDIKYIASSTKAQDTMDAKQVRRIIKNHEFMGGGENLLSIIREGLVSSSFEVIDTLTEGTKTFVYDSKDDLFKKLILDEILPKDQPNPPINFDEVIDSRKINEYRSMHTSSIGGSMSYRDSAEGENPFKYNRWQNAYGENKTSAEYKLSPIKRGFDRMLKKNPLTINVDGIEFIKGDFHKTIGRNIEVVFMNSQPETDEGADSRDKKKSGKYMIYSIRHMFKMSTDMYDVSATCIKIGNLRRSND